MALLADATKLQLMHDLEALGVKCTRIDLAADDFTRKRLVMDVIHQAATAGHVVGFRCYDPRRPLKNMQTGQLAGDTAYFGKRGNHGSGRYVRFYDKGLESNGEVDSIRYEVELSGQR